MKTVQTITAIFFTSLLLGLSFYEIKTAQQLRNFNNDLRELQSIGYSEEASLEIARVNNGYSEPTEQYYALIED